MHNPLRLHGSNKRYSSGYYVNLPILGGILRWLVGLVQLTEEEKKDAGIYLGHQTR